MVTVPWIWWFGKAPDIGGQDWSFGVYWITPDNPGHEFRGCGSTPADPTRAFVSATKEAYADVNVASPELVAAARKMLAQVEPYAKACGAMPKPRNPALNAKVSAIEGEVEFTTDGGKTFTTLTAKTVLKDGDFVATGFESGATLTFGHGSLRVHQLTQFRIDEFSNAAHLQRTRLYLNVGNVEANVRHTAAIRSDFAVVTPVCATGVRDSGMVVSTAKSGVTRVYTTSDVAYVTGLEDRKSTTLRKGYTTTVGTSKKASKPRRYSAAALKKLLTR